MDILKPCEPVLVQAGFEADSPHVIADSGGRDLADNRPNLFGISVTLQLSFEDRGRGRVVAVPRYGLAIVNFDAWVSLPKTVDWRCTDDTPVPGCSMTALQLSQRTGLKL